MEQLTLWSEEAPASRSASREGARGWPENPASCTSTYELYVNSVLLTLSGRTSRERSRARRGRLSDSSSMKWMNSGTVWRGAYSTRSTSEWPSDAAACSLSACLESGTHLLRYCLSPRALSGIFRRAKSRGRSLPMPLGAAMAAQTVWMKDA